MKRLAAFLALACVGAAQADPDERIVRSVRVVGWSLDYVAESDGGLLVRLRRDASGVRIEHVAEYWRGNGGPVRGTSLQAGDCARAEPTSIRDRDEPATAPLLRARLARWLGECGFGRRQSAAILVGLDPAHALFSAWARDAEAATRAEAQAIADYGRDPPDRD